MSMGSTATSDSGRTMSCASEIELGNVHLIPSTALGHSILRNRKRGTLLIGYAIRVTWKISVHETAP